MQSKIFDLSGRVALVTGGSKGLGKAMARAFADAGADVVICSRHQDELIASVAELADGSNARVEWIAADVADRRQASDLAQAVLSRMPGRYSRKQRRIEYPPIHRRNRR